MIQPLPLPRWHRRDVDLFTPTVRHLAAVSMRPPLRIPLSRPRFMPRILPLHPRRNGAFLFRSRDIRLEREQIPADFDFSRVNRVPRKYISPKEIEFFKIYYYTCVHREINNISHLLDF